MEHAWNVEAAGEAGWGEGVGGETPPTGGVWGATPRKKFQNLAPISCNLRCSEIIFVTDLKSYFLRKLWE